MKIMIIIYAAGGSQWVCMSKLGDTGEFGIPLSTHHIVLDLDRVVERRCPN